MFAVAVPASAPHGSQNIHSSRLVRHGALDPGKPFVNVLIAVKVLHVFLVVIVAGLNDKIGRPLEVAVSFRLSDVGILVVIGDHQLPRRTVQVGVIGAIGPLKNRAASVGIGL